MYRISCYFSYPLIFRTPLSHKNNNYLILSYFLVHKLLYFFQSSCIFSYIKRSSVKSYFSKGDKRKLFRIYLMSVFLGFLLQIPNHSRNIPWIGISIFFAVLASPFTFWALLLFLGAIEEPIKKISIKIKKYGENK